MTLESWGPVTGAGSVTEEEGHIRATQSLPLPATGKEMMPKARNAQQTGLCPSLKILSLLSTQRLGGHEVCRARWSLLASHASSFSQTRKAGLREASGLSKGHR